MSTQVKLKKTKDHPHPINDQFYNLFTFFFLIEKIAILQNEIFEFESRIQNRDGDDRVLP